MVFRQPRQKIPVSQKMVSQKQRSSLHHTLRLLGVLFTIIILVAMVFPPVSADDTSCYPKSDISSLDAPDTVYVGGEVLISSTVTQCSNCQYHWYVYKQRPYLTGELIYEDINPSFITMFYDAGSYIVDLNVTSPQPVCGDSLPFALATKTITAIDRCPADSLSVEVNQAVEPSTLGLTPPPFWYATTSKDCPDCTYVWSIYKTSEEVFADPVPLDSSDNTIYDGKPALQHTFREAGTYKINVKISNPPNRGCSENYASMTANHHVIESSSGSTGQPSDPQVIDPVPLSTTGTAAPTATATTSLQVTQPQVTYTAVPAGTQPVATLPTGSGQQGGQAGVPARSGTDNPASGASMAGTDAAPAGSGTGTTSVAPMTTTKTPGFAPVLSLCAGLLVLALRRR